MSYNSFLTPILKSNCNCKVILLSLKFYYTRIIFSLLVPYSSHRGTIALNPVCPPGEKLSVCCKCDTIVRVHMYSILPKVLQHVKKSLYNQPKPYFFKKLLWSHFWIDFNKLYTKTFKIVYILIVYLLIMFIWVVFICT